MISPYGSGGIGPKVRIYAHRPQRLRAFDMLLTFDLAEIKFLFSGSDVRPTVDRAHRLQGDISAKKLHDL